MQARIRIFVGSALVAAALISAASYAFVLHWERTAGGGADIRARGPWIAMLYLPYFALAAALVTAALALAVGRRAGLGVWWRLALAVGATALAAAAPALDPSAALLRAERAAADALGAAGPFLVHAALLAAGAWVFWSLWRRGPGPRAPAV